MATEGLRARARGAVRVQLAELAIGLFIEHGYDATTVDDIADAAGVSRRSFFRYFPSKDEVLFHGLDEVAVKLAAQIRSADGDDDWECLRQVLTEWHEQLYVSGRVLELVESSPALRARMVEKRDELRRQVSEALRERPGSTLDEFTADLLTAAAAAVLDVAAQEWLRAGGDRAELIRWGFEELSPGGRR
ncbi:MULTISPECIES: TetR family transcriptional regulator [unclassified Kribbella]|uniref:TetR family transcriptional regulator n=1 Tax=unclassified Kribbella TaxID=2644121 RepID=UPI00301682D3